MSANRCRARQHFDDLATDDLSTLDVGPERCVDLVEVFIGLTAWFAVSVLQKHRERLRSSQHELVLDAVMRS
jgi:hypothetical protein